jgi:hypothetical protein
MVCSARSYGALVVAYNDLFVMVFCIDDFKDMFRYNVSFIRSGVGRLVGAAITWHVRNDDGMLSGAKSAGNICPHCYVIWLAMLEDKN